MRKLSFLNSTPQDDEEDINEIDESNKVSNKNEKDVLDPEEYYDSHSSDTDSSSNSEACIDSSETKHPSLPSHAHVVSYSVWTSRKNPFFGENTPNFFHKLLDSWDWYTQRHPRSFRRILRRGVPSSLRGDVWIKITGARDTQSRACGDLYEKLQNTPSGCEHRIECDVHRTFPEHELFKDKEGIGQKRLFRILNAYAVFNSRIGYAQGMAFLAGFLLLHIDCEEDAFWVFVQMMEEMQVGGMFQSGLPRLHILLYQLSQLIKLHMPTLASHFRKQSISADIYGSPFIFTLFVHRMPFEAVERIWDVFFNESWKIVLRIILALLKINYNCLINASTPEVLRVLYDSASNINIEKLMKTALSFRVNNKMLKRMESRFVTKTETVQYNEWFES